MTNVADFSFDLTYEGLKLRIAVAVQKYGQRFDLTYEGLKLGVRSATWRRYTVLILPMRDWNALRLRLVGLRRLVLILPMRDWNLHESVFSCESGFLFWSYLWGIETWSVGFTCSKTSGFWSYLWGIETIFLRHIFFPDDFVLILPMRDWNQNFL